MELLPEDFDMEPSEPSLLGKIPEIVNGPKKSTFPMPAGMRGGAHFSLDLQYRYELWREWCVEPTHAIADGWFNWPDKTFSFWIGHNPSKGNSHLNDMTITRECGFTAVSTQFMRYLKMNVSDYISTDPKALLDSRIASRSEHNVQRIREAASQAGIIIMATGSLDSRLDYLLRDVLNLLRKDRRELWCLGTNNDGTPKHPSRLATATQLKRY